ncbi:DUF421 domain-containing protein [Nocardioidaceae bacterium]|nr:DUF421 domain-containing protein [Nocardioidaceae bacterium]
MWTDSEGTWYQVPLLALMGFALVVVLLRLSGKRTVAKFNMYDMVVTFTIGSLLSSTIVLETVGLMDGAMAMTAVVFLDWLVSLLALRSHRFRRLIKSEPSLLVYDGEMQTDTMRKERIVEEEVVMFMRMHGVDRLSHVKAMVLESHGDVSVFTDSGDGHDVRRSLQRSGVDIPGDQSTGKGTPDAVSAAPEE